MLLLLLLFSACRTLKLMASAQPPLEAPGGSAGRGGSGCGAGRGGDDGQGRRYLKEISGAVAPEHWPAKAVLVDNRSSLLPQRRFLQRSVPAFVAW